MKVNKQMPVFLLAESLHTVQPVTQQHSGIVHSACTLKRLYTSVYKTTKQRKQSYCQRDAVMRMCAFICINK